MSRRLRQNRNPLRLLRLHQRQHPPSKFLSRSGSLLESQQAAERAVKASRAERETRLAEIAKELEQLELVRRQARALLPQPAAAKAATKTPAVAGQKQ